MVGLRLYTHLNKKQFKIYFIFMMLKFSTQTRFSNKTSLYLYNAGKIRLGNVHYICE
jgi:hypothetical protein